MGAIETKIFKSGNSVAVRLPKELGLEVDTRVTIERSGRGITIRPVIDPAQERLALRDLVDTIRAIWNEAGGPPETDKREPIDFPDRPGLY